MPQLSDDRHAGSWTDSTHARRSAGRWQRPGVTISWVTGPPSSGAQVVVPGRHVIGQRVLDPAGVAVLLPELARTEQRLGRPGPHEPQRPLGPGRPVAVGPHRRPQGGACLVGRGVPVAAHVEVAVVDAPGVGGHRRARYRPPAVGHWVTDVGAVRIAGRRLLTAAMPAMMSAPPTTIRHSNGSSSTTTPTTTATTG